MAIKLNSVNTSSGFNPTPVEQNPSIKGLNTATGAVVKKGLSPYLNPNTGTWWEYNDKEIAYVDTGINAGIKNLEAIQTSSEPDGVNVIRATFTNGTTHDFYIYNGSRGVDGYTPIKGIDYFDGYTPRKGIDYFDGADGYTPQKDVDYFDGKDGVGVRSVSQTLESIKDGGSNLWTMELTNGKISRLQVRNGNRGSDGKDYQITARDYDAIAKKTVTFISLDDLGVDNTFEEISLAEIASWF